MQKFIQCDPVMPGNPFQYFDTILAAAAAFAGVFFGIKAMRILAVNIGFNIFAYYSLGIALFSFILFLTA